MKKLSLRKMFTPIVFILTIGIFALTYFTTKSSMLTALALFAIIDFASGIINAVKNEELDSRVCFNGICKKFYMFAIVAIAHELEQSLSIPLFDIVVSFYLANEGLSIMENAGNTIPFPEVLKKKFTQIRGGSTNEN